MALTFTERGVVSNTSHPKDQSSTLKIHFSKPKRRNFINNLRKQIAARHKKKK